MDEIPQSAVIFGALFLAFVIFITARGELPTYLAILTGRGTPDSAAPSATKAGAAAPATGNPLIDAVTNNPASVPNAASHGGQNMTIFGIPLPIPALH